MSGYVFGSDDPDEIRGFGEVAQWVREAVEAARAGEPGAAPVKAGAAVPVVSASGPGLSPTPDDGHGRARNGCRRTWEARGRSSAS
ncbi:hypothetical protein [Streptomyces sp. Y7]|uniref:hypothetical protein n=1 Tax=Streptomyces sp. Y7 TaxID=3342392 RepID=UPI00371D6B0B